MSSDTVKEWRRNTKRKMVLAMGGCCQSCGYKGPDDVYDMHHIDPTEKDFSFGSVRANPTSLERIIAELRKCVMLCANCHREIHSGHRQLVAPIAPMNESILRAKKRKCPECKKMFLDISSTQFCGRSCAGRHNQRVIVP